MELSAQPQRRFSFSASGTGVRNPTAMSLVKWSPPAALEDREVGRAAADVDHGHAEFTLVWGQHGLGGRHLLQHGVDDVDAGAIDAGDQVLHRRRATGHDVDVHVEARPGHADRVGDAFLVVHREVLWQHVEDLAAARQGERLGGIDGAPDVLARDLARLARHGDDTAAVEALDVRARERQIGRVDLDARRQLGLLDRLLDRLDRLLEVHHRATADAARVGGPDADDLDIAVVGHLADDGGDLGRPDVEPDQVSFIPRHGALPLLAS
jgi:hypothetical protein